MANRVAKIQSATKASQWRYVDSKQNPADYASRGMRVEELMKSERWFKAPEGYSFLARVSYFFHDSVVKS